MNLYVFRIAKGHEGGSPESTTCPNMSNLEKVIKDELKNIEVKEIPYSDNNYLSYLHNELWNSGKLRQGWGLKNLDLRIILDDETIKSYTEDDEIKSQQEWIKNYIISSKKYWNEKIVDNHCHIALGRYNILKHMKYAQKDDIFFIPKHSYYNHHDYNMFTVCKVIGNYYFDVDDRYNDFGHTLIVKELKSYEYSEETLTAKDFQCYQKAICKISDNNDKKFRNFINKYYKKGSK